MNQANFMKPVSIPIPHNTLPLFREVKFTFKFQFFADHRCDDCTEVIMIASYLTLFCDNSYNLCIHLFLFYAILTTPLQTHHMSKCHMAQLLCNGGLLHINIIHLKGNLLLSFLKNISNLSTIELLNLLNNVYR